MKCLKRLLMVGITVSCITLAPVQSSLADQHAPELQGLFEELVQATDATEAAKLEQMIWQHWLEAPDEQSHMLMRGITQAMAAADLAIALQMADELVQSHPDYAEAWNKRATLHYMLGNNDQSVADIRQTIALEPRHFGAISGLGLIFLRSQNFDAALAAFEQVLAISPASAGAKSSIARLRQEVGREI